MSDAPLSSTAPTSDTMQEPEIQVIPDKFYGAALRAQVPTAEEIKASSAASLDRPKRSRLPMILGVSFGILLLVGGAFVYFNQNWLFSKPKPVVQVVTPTPTPTPVPTTPPPPAPPTAPPTAPIGVSATSTSPQSVAVSWTPSSSDSTGFRVERADGTNPFVVLTNLPANSASFVDTSVQPSQAYRYRIVALNQGGESPASSETSSTVMSLPPPPPEQPKLPPAGLDSDSDGVTDLEEAIYGTNANNPDSDSDGFLDGNEVYNLYNPNGRAPSRLLDSGSVVPVKADIGWSMLVPKGWTTSLEGTNGSKMTVTTGHGETFALAVEDNTQNLSLVDWYLASHPDVKADQLLQYRSKKGYEGIMSPDTLSTYILWGNKVFSFTYQLDGQTFINFRTTYYMMMNSLILNGVPQEAVINQATGAEIKPLPFEPSATSTGVVAQPLPVVVTTTDTGVAPVTSPVTSTTP